MNTLRHSIASHEVGATTALSRDARRMLESVVAPLPGNPVLVIVSGLPGTGKSFISQRLAQRVPLAVLESDALRKAIAPSPTYSNDESARVFNAIHELIDMLLGQGVPVLLDATTLAEAHRERLYHIADRRGARVVLVRVVAPPEVVRQRLEARSTADQRQDHSDADWQVYQRLRPSQERIARNHIVVDTSQDVEQALGRIAREIMR